MRYYLIAGEASGDLHGANLMKAIKAHDSNAEFRFWGGDLMEAQGGEQVVHIKERAFMGFTEVISNISKVIGFLKQCKNDLLQWQPDALILVDYPGFNLKIAAFAHQHHIKVHYYIAPKVWAWNKKRVVRIRKYVDYLYCILPFEVDFFKSNGCKTDYVGNPLMDALENANNNPILADKKAIVALLPGSRKHEIKHMLPVMLGVAKNFSNYSFKIACAPNFNEEFYLSMGATPEQLVRNNTYGLLLSSDAALVTSGTATLETALLRVPQVVCYKTSGLTYFIAKLLIKVRFISLVNLCLNKALVTELIQNNLNVNQLTKELQNILSEEGKSVIMEGYSQLAEIIGKAGASERTAALITNRTTKHL